MKIPQLNFRHAPLICKPRSKPCLGIRNSDFGFRIWLWALGFLLALCFSAPTAHAAWGSIHGNNRSGSIPERPSFGGGGRGFEHNAPAVRAPEFRGGERFAPRPEERGREFSHAPEHNDWGRYRAWEGDRFRGDFDEDFGHSFFWSRFHPGVFLDVLPPGCFSFSIGGAPYYYYGGVYYEPQQGGYVVVAPPVGAVVPALPDGAESVVTGGSMLYYADGTFYAPAANGYQVVAPPMGVVVSMLPPDATPVVINGITYYQSDGMYYMPVMENGVTAYETVQPSAQGAVQPPPVQPQVQPPPIQPEAQPPPVAPQSSAPSDAPVQPQPSTPPP